MDWKHCVQQKLFEPDKCQSTVLGHLCGQTSKPLRLVALVQGQGENALFLYSMKQATIVGPDEINLENTLPLDSSFKLNIASKGTGPSSVIPFKFVTQLDNITVEFQQTKDLNTFYKDLKQALQVQSQNAAFGLPSSFSWIEKYTGVPSPAVNPFAEDTFDPFKTTQQISPESAVNNNWHHELLTQLNVGENCPVVEDDTHMRSTSSEVDFQSKSRPDYFTQMSAIDPPPPSPQSKEKADKPLENNMTELLQSGGGNDGGREKILKLVMSTKQDQYTEIKQYRIFCGTWNTNGQSATQTCEEWLCPAEDSTPPDIYAIGFQELDLSKNAYIFSESPKEEEWYQMVKKCLHPDAKYMRLKLVRLVGIMLVVFVKKDICSHIYNMESSTVGTGLMGMMGNKGGVAVRFEFHDTSLCFVNSHLAAHTEEYERRNQDFREINNRMCFTLKDSYDTYTISDHDMVFWIGDLNYRFSDLDNTSCKEKIAARQFDQLMNYDQLNRQMALKKVFLDYVEGRPNFVPTYRYDVGTNTFDTSEKNRTPAWCDRVLWRGSNITQLVYRSHPKMMISDHKPVSALFNGGIKIINQTKYRETYKEVMQKLDRLENEFLPQVKLDTTEIQFRNVMFVEPQTRNIQVTNTGQVPVKFEFIKKLEEDHYCKHWLTVEPYKSVINVGQSCTIQFEAYVNASTASKLNSGEDEIEDILVLHLEGGKDLFVSITGNYLASCFGSSIEALVYMIKPIREVPTESLIDLEHPGDSSPSAQMEPLEIPKELWRLVDHINRFGKECEDLFQQPGLHTEVKQVRDCLDTGVPSTLPGTIHSVAEALLLLFEALPEPVIPYKHYYACLHVVSDFTMARMALSKIPVSHRNVFKYICSFCRHLLRFSDKNNLQAGSLSTLFGNLLLRRPPQESSNLTAVQKKQEEQKKGAFVYLFLTNEYDE